MKLTKFGILVNKTTSLFTSIRDSNKKLFRGGVQKFWKLGRKFWGPILEKSRGKGGHTANPFRGGFMDIFWNHTLFSVHSLVLISVATA